MDKEEASDLLLAMIIMAATLCWMGFDQEQDDIKTEEVIWINQK